MKISKILYNPVKINTSFKSLNKSTNPIEYKQADPDKALEVFYGQELIQKPQNTFQSTLDENYFRLPEGCSPDGFQVESGKALLQGYDVLADAPTGTGKTAIAHYVVSKNMKEGKTTFYTTPIKALSNQKLNEFREVYGKENVGIMTGDRRENVTAPVVIMTTEVYRNMALSNMYGDENPLFKNLGTVIFDEFHYLGDESRGAVWEESVMMTPENVQKLALSATIGNAKDLNGWFNSLTSSQSQLVSIPESARHVPLTYDIMPTSSYRLEEKRINKSIKKTGEIKHGVIDNTVSKPSLSDFKFTVGKLNKKNQLPAILFVFSKNYSKKLLDYFGEEGEDLTTREEKKQIEDIVNKYKSQKYIGAGLNIEALKKGYAMHNAGIIPNQKELIEELFQKKLLKCVIATETLAAGINMPAKTVVISSPYKPSDTDDTDSGSRLLTPNEFKQMSGRAGRRGIDTIGYVYTMPTNQMIKEEFDILENSESNSILSGYNPDYAFLSGYFEHNSGTKDLKNLYGKTFYTYSNNAAERKQREDEMYDLTKKKNKYNERTRFD